MAAVASAAANGDYEPLADATSLLMRAQTHGASVLERHAALERFAAAACYLLASEGAHRSTIADTRRLFAFLRHRQLSAAR